MVKARRPDTASPLSGAVVIRRLQGRDEYQACLELQRKTWGASFSEFVSPALLMVSQKIGGVVAGALDAEDRLLGFVYGLTGVKDGRIVHWSHMLAVRDGFRGAGLGRRLKLYQRELLLDLGVDLVYWTYDPLVARNAHLNLNRLGAEIAEYEEDLYGDSDSDLHRGLGTDRFIVEWRIRSQRVEQAIAGALGDTAVRFLESPIVNSQVASDGIVRLVQGELPIRPEVRVEIPSDIQVVKHESLEEAAAWRDNTRKTFTWYMRRGYRVGAFYRDLRSGRCFYGLSSRSPRTGKTVAGS